MSNLLKRGFVSSENDNKRVIDSNALVAERIKLLKSVLNRPAADENDTREFDEDGFSAGLNAENVDALLADNDAGAAMMNPEPEMPDLEEINAQAEQILADARAEAQNILQEAAAEAEANKQAVFDEARAAGHDEGYQAGLAEVDTMKAELQNQADELQQEYENILAGLEPELIAVFTDIYEHIFHVSLSDNKEIIFYLIQKTLRGIEGGNGMMIHVSKEDYGFVSMQKKELLAGVSNADETDIVEDVTLKPNEAFIETGAGIFDCSLETELSGLKRMLRLLSYEQEEGQ